MENNKRVILSNVELIRAFTILVVVLGHSMIIYSNDWNIFEAKNHSAFFYNLKKYIDVFQMPLFIFISGYIYSYVKIEKKKYDNTLSFFKNKFKRLIIPFLCVALFYVIPIRELINYSPYQDKSILNILFECVLLGKDIGHLWYLPTLFLIFITFYFLEKKLLSIFPYIINIIILIIISCGSSFLPSILYISYTATYFLFFYLGYVIRNLYKDKESDTSYTPILVLFFLQFIGLFITTILPNDSFIMKGIGSLSMRMGSIFGILFYYILFTKINNIYPSISNNRFIKFIDKESFPIYLFHSPIIYSFVFFSKQRY